MKDPLNDKEFLKELDTQSEREIYARIILLDFAENPIQTIEGRATAGSISIDGNSTVRRSCSLTLVAKDINISDFYWGLRDKCRIEVGLTNKINSDYPDIIWFKQGIFVITSLNTSQTTNNCIISLQGKDKMCLLNGDVGGNLPASIDFGTIDIDEETDNYIKASVTESTFNPSKHFILVNDEYKKADIYDSNQTYYQKEIITTNQDIPIKDIIREAVSVYGNEPLNNIVINDLDDYGLELLEYRGDVPLYMLKNLDYDLVANMRFKSSKQYYYKDNNNNIQTIQIDELEESQYDKLISSSTTTPLVVYADDPSITKNPTPYSVIKLTYGDTAGYRLTELTYAGDLISSIGETLTSILDKIVKMLGTFEYFYDVDGRFIFQKKKIYTYTSWNSLINTEDDVYAEDAAYTSAVTYNFENATLVSAFSNQPKLTNLKNDYSVWGTRTSVSGASIPVHYRFALENKPKYYKNMADPNIIYITQEEKKKYEELKENYVVCDWREIIYQMALDYFQYYRYTDDFLTQVSKNNYDYYPTGVTGYECFYTDMQGFWRELYNPDSTTRSNEYGEDGWNTNVYDYPEVLNFWIDFLDAEEDIGQYKISNIGNRAKVVNDSTVKAISYKDTPTALFLTSEEYNELVATGEIADKTGYTFLQLTNSLEDYFTISAQGKSAKEALDDLLYQYTYCAESATITTLPVYYLEPNTRIFVKDEDSGVEGEYIINKLTVPLAYNGTMSISATKAISNLY